MKYLVSIFLLILFTGNAQSAKGDGDYSAPKFSSIQPKTLIHLNDDLIMRMTNHIMLYDSVIIFPAKSVDNNNVFQVLSAKDGHLVTSFAHLGRSAEELSDYTRQSVDAKRGLLYALYNSN